jgi:carboxyl-terminal processing protease
MNVRRAGLFVGLTAGLILSLVFVLGFVAGTVFGRHEVSSGADLSDPNVRDFVSAYNLVTEQSYYRPFNKHELVYAAIDGMLNATGDPHTIFLSPPENRTASQELNGAGFSGIGAVVVPAGKTLHVLAPMPGSPAARAGIRAGDALIAVDGTRVSRLTSGQAIARIHGPTGTVVRLTVVRGKSAPFTVNVKRAKIAPITAYADMLPHHVGYVRILSFGDDTADQVTRSLRILRADRARAIVVDLRDNPGGYVEAAQQIVSDFLSSGVVAYEKRTHQDMSSLPVLTGHRVLQVPIAVLVNAQTASAAEITAAALRDEAHAVLVGTRTYGKGSMQSVYSLADGSTVRITDRLWLTPRKKSISGVGLTPNIVVRRAPSARQGDPALIAAERYLLRHFAR